MIEIIRKDKIKSVISKYPPKAVEIFRARYKLELEGTNKSKSETKQRREKALTSMTDFIQIYFSHYFNVEFGEQQKELIRDIEGFKEKQNREPLKLLRALSRGFGKSTLMSLVGILWLCLRKEWHFVILVSSTLEAAKGFLRKIVEETEDNERLLSDFPELNPAIDNKGQTVSWKDTDIVFRGGFRIISKGFLNAIRGQRHKQYRPSALVIDDPDEEKDVSSDSTMQRKYRWLDRAALQLGTSWGIDVMVAYTTISPNCIGEVIYSNPKYSDWSRKKFKAIEVDPKTGKEYSTWEAGAPLKTLLLQRDGDPSRGLEGDPITFAREKQNEVLAEIDQKFKGLISTYVFNRQEIETWRKILVVDLSLGKSETSDFSAIIGVARSPSGKYREIFSSIERRKTNQIVDDLIDILQLYNWEICGIESTANQEHFLNTFRLLLEEYNRKNPHKVISVPLIPIINSGDKIQRITATLQPMFAGGLIEIREDSKRLYKQLDEFPYEKKDGPDALEMAISYLKNHGIEYIGATDSLKNDQTRKEKEEAERIYRERMKRFSRGY